MSAIDYLASTKAVRVYLDGRECCLNTVSGRREYARRRQAAWEAQFGLCAICKRPMSLEEATADHVKSRGMGAARRDDRQSNIQAVHLICNGLKGSRSL